jgi:thioredoxin 1
MKVPDISSSEHHRNVVQQEIALIDYYVSWCSPCRVQASIIERVADDVEGKACVARMNLDQHRHAAEVLRIRSVPTLVVFINGREVRRFIGLQSRETLTGCLMEVIQGCTRAVTA